MATKDEGLAARGEPASQGADEAARISKLAAKGIRTSDDYCNYMSALVSDITEGKVDVRTASAICNAAGKLMQGAVAQHRYGTKDVKGNFKPLQLAPGK